MNGPAAREQDDETQRRALAATVRALAGDDRLQLEFAPGPAQLAPPSVRLPPPPPRMPALERAALHGAADLLALRHRYHVAAVAARYRPGGRAAQEVFERAEQARLAALGGQRYAGVAENVMAALELECRRLELERASDRAGVPLEIAAGLLIQERVSGRPLPPAAESAARWWRQELTRLAGPLLDQLAARLHDQAGFARLSRELIRALSLEDAPSTPAPPAGSEPAETSPSSAGDAPPDESDPASEQEAKAGQRRPEPGGPEPPPGSTPAVAAGSGHYVRPVYRPFCDEFDRIVRPDTLCEPDELQALRARLDEQTRPLRGSVLRLAAGLQRRILARQRRLWEPAWDEGALDPTRLAALIAQSGAHVFSQEREIPARDTVVSLLVDCSGSMRGRPIAIAALCAEVFALALERCGVKVEILGFTTCDWSGGRSRERWIERGRPAQPGRLNDLLHIVFKRADQPLRQARQGLAAMLSDAVLKQNVDGEALLWAHRRLLARPEQRRLLLVISDGLPLDTATLQANPDDLLERHLRTVIEGIERRSAVELAAIGIGHEVGGYYRRAVTIRDSAELAGAMVTQLTMLIERSPTRRRRMPL